MHWNFVSADADNPEASSSGYNFQMIYLSRKFISTDIITRDQGVRIIGSTGGSIMLSQNMLMSQF